MREPGYHLGLVSYILVLCQRFKGEDFVCKGFFNAFYMFKKFKKQKSIFLRQVFKNFFNSSHRNSFKGEFSVYSKLALYFKDTVIIIVIVMIMLIIIIIIIIKLIKKILIIIPCTH